MGQVPLNGKQSTQENQCLSMLHSKYAIAWQRLGTPRNAPSWMAPRQLQSAPGALPAENRCVRFMMACAEETSVAFCVSIVPTIESTTLPPHTWVLHSRNHKLIHFTTYDMTDGTMRIRFGKARVKQGLNRCALPFCCLTLPPPHTHIRIHDHPCKPNALPRKLRHLTSQPAHLVRCPSTGRTACRKRPMRSAHSSRSSTV